MPELSRFFGIVIGIFYREHGRQHFHAVYGELKRLSISTQAHNIWRVTQRSLNPCERMASGPRCGTKGELRVGTAAQDSKENCTIEVRTMKYHVIAAEYVSGYVIRLKFRDGTAGEIDLSEELNGPIFEPLRNIETFKQFKVHPEFHTVVWPNGADLAPEFLRQNLRITA
jgi:hypothetical protein